MVDKDSLSNINCFGFRLNKVQLVLLDALSLQLVSQGRCQTYFKSVAAFDMSSELLVSQLFELEQKPIGKSFDLQYWSTFLPSPGCAQLPTTQEYHVHVGHFSSH